MKKESKIFYPISQFNQDIYQLFSILQKLPRPFTRVYGIPKGGVPIAIALAGLMDGMKVVDKPEMADLIVDDLCDTGRTLKTVRDRVPAASVAVLHRKAWCPIKPNIILHDDCKDWIVYWWEGTEEKSVEDAVIRQLQFIGEDPTREGLRETPSRVVRAWGELFAGYKTDPASVCKTFSDGACDEMVLLKNCEFYSTCEHHLLPFFGKAHIAYIPDGKVIGVSKLARLLEVYARRLQIQERLGQQVTKALVDNLMPKGAACVLEAQHFCMTSRGVQKQDSVMITSSLTGVFRDKPEARAEFMGLIR